MDKYYLLDESGQNAYDILDGCKYNTQIAFENLRIALTTELNTYNDETRLKAQAIEKILNDIIEDYCH